MMKRRTFLKTSGLAGITSAVMPPAFRSLPENDSDDRTYTVGVLTSIAEPVLDNLSKGELRKNMPVRSRPGQSESRKQVTHLEAFGRLMAGIAPWLELGSGSGSEDKVRKKYADLVIKSIEMAVDPASPDFMNFNNNSQALVDSAFLAHGLLRSPGQILGKLSHGTRKNLIQAMKSSRVIKPYFNNWLLFSAMVETLLLYMGEDADLMRIDYAVKQHLQWYKGDGWYGDGPEFHWDYYNSFVIQPMLLDVVRQLVDHEIENMELYELLLKRAQRYSVIQERLISPEGTYPPIGRSLAYRFGVFQLLTQLAFHHQLPGELPPSQVRSAITAVIRKQVEAPGTFDEQGWLKIGFCGYQPDVGEDYISTGSLYLCATGLLHLGLSPNDPFWKSPPADWTQKKSWNGKSFPIDHAM